MSASAMRKSAHGGNSMGRSHGKPYARLAVMMAVSLAAMYVLMYAMVNELRNAIPNLNQAYMAGLMAASMLVIELAVMGGMYPRTGLNAALLAAGAVLVLLFWAAIRSQAAIGDREFLRSMIPHHAGAVLMCRQAAVSDAEIRKLCGDIIESQQREIDQMRGILERMRS